jgi:hypothetical protein
LSVSSCTVRRVSRYFTLISKWGVLSLYLAPVKSKSQKIDFVGKSLKNRAFLQFEKENFLLYFFFFSVCFETDMFVSVFSKQVRNTEANRNKPKKIVCGFAKQTENQAKQIEFRFVLVGTEIFVCFFSRFLNPLSNYFK